MKDIKYALCQHCNTVHYTIDKEDFDILEKENADIFSKRNLRYCFTCGKKDKFVNVEEKDADAYLSGADIPALYIE